MSEEFIKPEIDHGKRLRRVMHILMAKGCGSESNDVLDALNELERLQDAKPTPGPATLAVMVQLGSAIERMDDNESVRIAQTSEAYSDGWLTAGQIQAFLAEMGESR